LVICAITKPSPKSRPLINVEKFEFIDTALKTMTHDKYRNDGRGHKE